MFWQLPHYTVLSFVCSFSKVAKERVWIGALSPQSSQRKMLSVQLDYFVERTVPVGVKALLTNREPPEALFATYTIKSGKKKLRIQKYPDTWGRGLSRVINTHCSENGLLCKSFLVIKIFPSTRSVFKSNSPVHTHLMVSGFTQGCSAIKRVQSMRHKARDGGGKFCLTSNRKGLGTSKLWD